MKVHLHIIRFVNSAIETSQTRHTENNFQDLCHENHQPKRKLQRRARDFSSNNLGHDKTKTKHYFPSEIL